MWTRHAPRSVVPVMRSCALLVAAGFALTVRPPTRDRVMGLDTGMGERASVRRSFGDGCGG
jgi:hypothetical protein